MARRAIPGAYDDVVDRLERLESALRQVSQTSTLIQNILINKPPDADIDAVQFKQKAVRDSTLGSWLWFLGFESKIIRMSSQNSQSFYISASFRLPALRGSSSRVLTAQFTLRYYAGWTIHIAPPRLSKLVPENAEIMTSCAQGDIAKVQSLLQSGKAHPLDITPSNLTPLYVSL